MIHNFGNSFAGNFGRSREESEAQYKEQSYDCFDRKRQREGSTVWRTEFALGFRLYTDISLSEMIPKVKIFLIWSLSSLFYLIAKQYCKESVVHFLCHVSFVHADALLSLSAFTHFILFNVMPLGDGLLFLFCIN